MSTLNTVSQPGRLAVVGAVAALALAAAPAAGQQVIQGFARSNQSDVTGPSVTTGDMVNGFLATRHASSRALRNYTCPVAWGVRTTSEGLGAQLRAGRVVDDITSESLGAVAQRTLYDLLYATSRGEEAAREFVAALTRQGADENRAEDLARSLHGLLAASSNLQPASPSPEAATQLTAAVMAYNALIDRSPASLLASAPDELDGTRMVLRRLVEAARDNDGRVVTQADLYSSVPGVLPCAPMTEMRICVLLPGDNPRYVHALFVPATGDTLVEVNGRRERFADLYPIGSARYAADESWFLGSPEIVIRGQRYVRFGLSRQLAPEALETYDSYLGVPVLVSPGAEHPPTSIFLSAAPDCTFQEYRRADVVPRVRG